MRTYKKLLTLLLCGLLAATVASAQTLVLRHANGALTQMPLTSETSITFDDGKTVVGNRAYAASDIVSIAYKDETMPVEGDVNGDTQVNVGDIMAIINYMAGQANMGVDVADVNGDGNVNVGDVMSVINIMAGYNAQTSCPDANHPHMIDLGLPSGTQWACCNVGASAPEQYGNYYAWGETSPRSFYSPETYQYYNSGTGYVNIGSDIAGSQYDAATANWGAPWRMPSVDQMGELVNNCNSVWTTQNGVNGRKFTGPNGGTIFLPAAGSDGIYWSSTYYWPSNYEGYPNFAYVLGFGTGGVSPDWGYNRWSGLSVRPVR